MRPTGTVRRAHPSLSAAPMRMRTDECISRVAVLFVADCSGRAWPMSRPGAVTLALSDALVGTCARLEDVELLARMAVGSHDG